MFHISPAAIGVRWRVWVWGTRQQESGTEQRTSVPYELVHVNSWDTLACLRTAFLFPFYVLGPLEGNIPVCRAFDFSFSGGSFFFASRTCLNGIFLYFLLYIFVEIEGFCNLALN